MPTDTFRDAMFIKLQQRGASPKVAGQGCLAIHFLHDDLVPSSRQFEKACRKLSKATAKATKKTPVEDLGPLFVSALGELRGLAEAAGEMGYVTMAERGIHDRCMRHGLSNCPDCVPDTDLPADFAERLDAGDLTVEELALYLTNASRTLPRATPPPPPPPPPDH